MLVQQYKQNRTIGWPVLGSQDHWAACISPRTIGRPVLVLQPLGGLGPLGGLYQSYNHWAACISPRTIGRPGISPRTIGRQAEPFFLSPGTVLGQFQDRANTQYFITSNYIVGGGYTCIGMDTLMLEHPESVSAIQVDPYKDKNIQSRAFFVLKNTQAESLLHILQSSIRGNINIHTWSFFIPFTAAINVTMYLAKLSIASHDPIVE